MNGGGPSPTPEDQQRLLELLAGKHRAQALSTAAALGLPDLLRAQPGASGAELAAALHCEASVLERLLRLLCGLGFAAEPEPDRFALTPLGATLCRDALGPLAEFAGAPEQWDPWSRLRQSLAAGAPPPFSATFGRGLYEFLAADAEAAARYDRAIDAFTRHEAACLEDELDLEQARRIVDVGGGRGTLLLALLRRWPHLHGVLFDLPHVVAAAGPRLAAACEGRASTAAGDFFADLPAGADVYLLKHVLHNWDDARAVALLRRCGECMADGGLVVVIDAVLAPDNRADLARLLDLEMHVLTGGRQRRKPEWRRLFADAGLRLEAPRPLTAASWLLSARRR